MATKICANCHFLVRQYHNDRGAELVFSVTPEQRAKASRGDFSWQRDEESLACFKGVWDEGAGFGTLNKSAAISSQNRRKSCYFFRFEPGMLLPAAEKLQSERLATSGDHFKLRLTIYGVLLALIGLVIKVAYGP